MSSYLFVYPSLSLGGIETFFVRLARQFERKNKRLKFLFLFKEGGNEELMFELAKHADIFYWEDFCFCGTVKGLNARLKFFMPLKKKEVVSFFSECEVVHVSCALTYFTMTRIFAVLKSPVKVVFGVYHSNELAWGKSAIPLYEKYFRKFIFGKNKLMLLFFNDASKRITLGNNEIADVLSCTFPLGVDLPEQPRVVMPKAGNSLHIVSVGRLTEFKTYNMYMLQVVDQLVKGGFDIKYDIYGSGPLQKKMLSEIDRLGLANRVVLHGDLRYALLDETLRKYEIFVGTGTALLHAAANGVPCVTAIENEQSARTYGFFSELSGADYHEQNSGYDKKHIQDVLIDFMGARDDERGMLEKRHVSKSTSFGMEVCADNFQLAFQETPYSKCLSRSFYIYMGLFFMAEFIPRLLGKSNFRKKYDHVL